MRGRLPKVFENPPKVWGKTLEGFMQNVERFFKKFFGGFSHGLRAVWGSFAKRRACFPIKLQIFPVKWLHFSYKNILFYGKNFSCFPAARRRAKRVLRLLAGMGKNKGCFFVGSPCFSPCL